VATTVHCPETHTQLARVGVGIAFGSHPGHQYHDVDILISRYGDMYHCHIVESWGAAQDCNDETGRREVFGRDNSIAGAGREAERAGRDAGIDNNCLTQAMGRAIDEAERPYLYR
jgi:hypothetical protein